MCQITLVFKARTFDSTDFDSELQENGNLQKKIKKKLRIHQLRFNEKSVSLEFSPIIVYIIRDQIQASFSS